MRSGNPPVPAPPRKRILVWHQGALGDLLLAGPALEAISRLFPEGTFTGVGRKAFWRLLATTLPVEAVWSADEGDWSWLYQEQGSLPAPLIRRLSGMELAVVFSPRPRRVFLARLKQAGVPEVIWIPSFPVDGAEPVSLLHARRLQELGLQAELRPFRLRLEALPRLKGEFAPGDRILTLAPGSGQPAKNWPLAHYYEIARALAWEAGLKVVWLTGPAEEALLPYIEGIAQAQGQAVWASRPLEEVAALLARTWVYVGSDSGITHLAAAAGARRVVALFGPTDPRVWAPLGDNVTVLTVPGDRGEKAALEALRPARVLAEIQRYL